MRSNNGAQSVYGLCHFPYEDENASTDQPKQYPNMMHPHLPFSSVSSNYDYQYSPDHFNGYTPSPPNPGSFYNEQNGINGFGSGGSFEDNFNEVVFPRMPKIDNQEVVELNRTPKKTTAKLPRHYKKKTEQEKKDPTYKEIRYKNNEAVRKTREKTKLKQEAQQREYEEMKKLIEVLKKRNTELEKKNVTGEIAISLISSYQREVNSNPQRHSVHFSPTLDRMLHFKIPKN